MLTDALTDGVRSANLSRTVIGRKLQAAACRWSKQVAQPKVEPQDAVENLRLTPTEGADHEHAPVNDRTRRPVRGPIRSAGRQTAETARRGIRPARRPGYRLRLRQRELGRGGTAGRRRPRRGRGVRPGRRPPPTPRRVRARGPADGDGALGRSAPAVGPAGPARRLRLRHRRLARQSGRRAAADPRPAAGARLAAADRRRPGADDGRNDRTRRRRDGPTRRGGRRVARPPPRLDRRRHTGLSRLRRRPDHQPDFGDDR